MRYYRTKDLIDRGYANNRTQLHRLIDQRIIPPPTYISCTPVWTDTDLAEVDARLMAERDARQTLFRPRPSRRDQAAAEPAPATPEPAPPAVKRRSRPRKGVVDITRPDNPNAMICGPARPR